MNALEREIQAAAAWLREQGQVLGYGELNVKLILHGGAVTRTERTVTSKLQPQAGNGHVHTGS